MTAVGIKRIRGLLQALCLSIALLAFAFGAAGQDAPRPVEFSSFPGSRLDLPRNEASHFLEQLRLAFPTLDARTFDAPIAEVKRLLLRADALLGSGGIGAERVDGERMNQEARALLATILEEHGQVLAMRPASVPEAHHVSVDGAAADILLKVGEGDEAHRYRVLHIDLGAMPEAGPPPFIPVAPHAATYVLVRLSRIPSGDTQLRLAFGPAERQTALLYGALRLERAATTRIDFRITDDTGETTPAMVRFENTATDVAIGPAEHQDYYGQIFGVLGQPGHMPGDPVNVRVPPPWNGAYWVSRGTGHALLPAGQWRIRAYRGPEVFPASTVITVQPNGRQTITLELARGIDMASRGWYSGDDHVHAQLMSDDDADALLLAADAMDVHVLNILRMGNPRRTHYEQRGFGEDFRVTRGGRILVPGTEEPRTMYAHGVGLNIDTPVRDLSRYFDYEAHAKRVREAGGLFGYAHLDWFDTNLETAVSMPANVADFVSVMQWDRLEDGAYFDLLDLGFFAPASAGSDVPYEAWLGQVRVYAHIGEVPFTPGAWFDALEKGRTFVTNGPMLDFQAGDSGPGGIISVQPGEAVAVHALARGLANHSAPQRIEVILNSEVIATVESENPSDATLDWEGAINPGFGGWLTVRVLGHDGGQALATPVRLLREGFRPWNHTRAPGLIQLMRDRIAEYEAKLAAVLALKESNEYSSPWWPGTQDNAMAGNAARLRERFANALAVYRELEEIHRNEAEARAEN